MRHFTLDDIRAIRNTWKSQIKRTAYNDELETAQEYTKKWHDLNEGQLFAINSLGKKYDLSDDEIVSKLHLITDEMNTLADIAELYNISLDKPE